jgi:hypothetical protein
MTFKAVGLGIFLSRPPRSASGRLIGVFFVIALL